MDTKMKLPAEIDSMKRLLTTTAEEHNFDFQHPSVLQLSHQLDLLIIKTMKDEYNNSSSIDFSAIFGLRMFKWLIEFSLPLEFSLFQSKHALSLLELVSDLQQPLRSTSQDLEQKNTVFYYLH